MKVVHVSSLLSGLALGLLVSGGASAAGVGGTALQAATYNFYGYINTLDDGYNYTSGSGAGTYHVFDQVGSTNFDRADVILGPENGGSINAKFTTGTLLIYPGYAYGVYADAAIQYYVEILGGPDGAKTVPLTFTANGMSSNQVDSVITVDNYSYKFPDTATSIQHTVDVPLNTPILVSLTLSTTYALDTTAFIDPAFSVGPGYNLIASDGVTLSSPSPEPSTWALMMVGVGGMGAALRARRRTVGV